MGGRWVVGCTNQRNAWLPCSARDTQADQNFSSVATAECVPWRRNSFPKNRGTCLLGLRHITVLFSVVSSIFCEIIQCFHLSFIGQWCNLSAVGRLWHQPHTFHNLESTVTANIARMVQAWHPFLCHSPLGGPRSWAASWIFTVRVEGTWGKWGQAFYFHPDEANPRTGLGCHRCVGLGRCLGLHIQFWRLSPVLVVLQPCCGLREHQRGTECS